MLPEYFNGKVDYFVALAPIVRLDHSTNGAMVAASQIVNPLTTLIQALGLYNLVPRSGIAGDIMGSLCKLAPHLCVGLEEGFFDWNNEIDNASRYPDKETHGPSGSGWRNLIHYGQIIKAKQFQRYDFGSAENMKKYNSATPPKYDLSAIPLKMALMSGDVDALGDPTDVKWLKDESQSGLRTDLIKLELEYHYGHNSFMMANNMAWVQDAIKLIKPSEEIQIE